MFTKHYSAFLKAHYKVCIIFGILLVAVCGTLWVLENEVENAEVVAPPEDPSEHLLKITASDFRENKQELQEKYPALPIWNTPNMTDAHMVDYLNFVIETSSKAGAPLEGKVETYEEALAYANALTEKWGDPQKTSELRQRTRETLQEAEALLATREKRKLLRDDFMEAAEKLIADLKREENEQQFQGVMDTEQQFQRQETGTDNFQRFSDDPAFSENSEDLADHTPTMDEAFQPPPNLPTENLGITFTADEWQDTFMSEVSDWDSDLSELYPNVFTAQLLSSEEFDVVFPTEASRQILESRQQQMQSEIVQRVENFLSNDTPGNREEKLSIIRQTLSENWSPDIADSVIEQLR